MKALLVGDMSPTYITDPMFAQKQTDALFHDVRSLFAGNDINFVNLECALTDHDADIEKIGPPLKADGMTADTLKDLGVTVCGLSNNHIFDYGKKGAADTIAHLDRVGLDYTGFGASYEDSRKNYIVEKDGERICIIAVCEHEYSYALDNRMGSRPYDEYDTMADIRAARPDCDRLIVIYHGGKEMCQYPSPRLYKLCRAMVDNGADVVLCQHSHCIGCYENYKGAHILYGQGNFHFVKPKFLKENEKAKWNTSLAVKYDSKANAIEFVPLHVFEDGIEIAKEAEGEKILAEFAARNAELASGAWKEKWHEFCMSVKGQYVKVIAEAFAPGSTKHQDDFFGHYLDCEAHADVFRELFPTANHTNEL